jgi:CheY-like chemotaxis protein
VRWIIPTAGATCDLEDCRYLPHLGGMNARRTILLLENDENDAFVFRRALTTLGFDGEVRHVEGLAEARAYLIGSGGYGDRKLFPLPDLIVADFGLGAATGADFVQWLLEQPDLMAIPVIFFSGSLPAGGARELVARFGYPVFKKEVDFQTNKRSVGQMLELIEPQQPAGPA